MAQPESQQICLGLGGRRAHDKKIGRYRDSVWAYCAGACLALVLTITLLIACATVGHPFARRRHAKPFRALQNHMRTTYVISNR
jgi:hypothetical protein